MTHRRVRGQALVETLVAMLFLSPLFLCAVYLTDFHRASHAAEMAAHELALASLHAADGAVGQTDLQAIRDLAIPAADILGERLPAHLESLSTSDTASSVEEAAHLILAPALVSGVGAFDLPRWQQHRVSTGVSMGSTAAIGVPFDIPIELRGRSVYVVGHGAAVGSAHVRTRTAAISIAGAMAEVARPIETVASVARVIEPALSQLCVGRIDPDIVPADRLPASVSRHNDLRTQPC